MAAHAKLSCSGSAQWLNCSKSVLAQEAIPNTSTSFADEGSVCHALAETCLKSGRYPEDYLGQTFPEWPEIPVNQEMIDAVNFYSEIVTGVISSGGGNV